jgi:hypothetical protein
VGVLRSSGKLEPVRRIRNLHEATSSAARDMLKSDPWLSGFEN